MGKYQIIHILPISAINPDVFELPVEHNALIVCCDEYNQYFNLYKYRLIIPFADTVNKNLKGAISREQAHLIVEFVQGLPEDVTELFICCSEGLSRSTAVAAAILKGTGRNDETLIWDNPHYTPNRLVYQMVCREFGLEVSDQYVDQLIKRNRACFKMLGTEKKDKHELWQIIE